MFDANNNCELKSVNLLSEDYRSLPYDTNNINSASQRRSPHNGQYVNGGHREHNTNTQHNDNNNNDQSPIADKRFAANDAGGDNGSSHLNFEKASQLLNAQHLPIDIPMSPHHHHKVITHTSQGPAVEVIRVAFKYQQNEVLQNINITVPSGQIYALLGPSGSGKTTLLRLILGRIRVKSGSIYVFGNSKPGAHNRHIGYMPQDKALSPELTIGETIDYFASLYGLSGRRLAAQKAELRKVLQLSPDDQVVSTLSGGQQKALSLALVFLHSPRLVILDEPTVGTDPLLGDQIWDYLRRSCAQGLTVIIVTHYIQEAALAQSVGMMRNGRIIEEGTPESLYEKYNENDLEKIFIKICTDRTLLQQQSEAQQQKGAETLQKNISNFLSYDSPHTGLVNHLNDPNNNNIYHTGGKKGKWNGSEGDHHENGNKAKYAYLWLLLILVRRNVQKFFASKLLAILMLSPVYCTLLMCICFKVDRVNLPVAVYDPNTPLGAGSERFLQIAKNFSVYHFDYRRVNSIDEALKAVERGGALAAFWFDKNFTESLEIRALASTAQQEHHKTKKPSTTINEWESATLSPKSETTTPGENEAEVETEKPKRMATMKSRTTTTTEKTLENTDEEDEDVDVNTSEKSIGNGNANSDAMPTTTEMSNLNTITTQKLSDEPKFNGTPNISSDKKIVDEDGTTEEPDEEAEEDKTNTTTDPEIDISRAKRNSKDNKDESESETTPQPEEGKKKAKEDEEEEETEEETEEENGDNVDEPEHGLISNASLRTSSIHVAIDHSNALLSRPAADLLQYSAWSLFNEVIVRHDRYPLANPVVVKEVVYAEGTDAPDFLLSGYMIGFLYLSQVTLTAQLLIQERKDGFFDRAIVAGAKHSLMFFSHFITNMIFALMQTTLMCLIGFAWYKIPNFGSYYLVFGLVMLQSASSIMTGLFISSICKESFSAFFVALSISVSQLFTSGAVFPIISFDPLLKTLMNISPIAMPVESLRNVMLRGWDLSNFHVYHGFTTNVVITIIFGTLALMVFIRNS